MKRFVCCFFALAQMHKERCEISTYKNKLQLLIKTDYNIESKGIAAPDSNESIHLSNCVLVSLEINSIFDSLNSISTYFDHFSHRHSNGWNDTVKNLKKKKFLTVKFGRTWFVMPIVIYWGSMCWNVSKILVTLVLISTPVNLSNC